MKKYPNFATFFTPFGVPYRAGIVRFADFDVKITKFCALPLILFYIYDNIIL